MIFCLADWRTMIKATAWLRILVVLVAGAAAVAGGACTHITPPTPESPAHPPLPFIAGTYDCTAVAIWRTTTFAGLVPAVERAVATDNPDGALVGLLGTHHAEEVTCVAGYVHDQSLEQQAAATDKALPAKRVAATAAWMQQQASKGMIVTNYGGEAH
jgi:hypothetical protein